MDKKVAYLTIDDAPSKDLKQKVNLLHKKIFLLSGFARVEKLKNALIM